MDWWIYLVSPPCLFFFAEFEPIRCFALTQFHTAVIQRRRRRRRRRRKEEEGREYLAREPARVDARKQAQSSTSRHKRVASEDWDRPPEKFQRIDEEDVTVRQDITATSGTSSSSASRGPALRKRPAVVRTEDLEDNEQMDANESTSPFLQAKGGSSDGRFFVGSWERDECETHNQHL